jgi:hypothetical protein
MNDKNEVTQERIYPEERKKRRASRITKEVVGYQKSMERPRQQRKTVDNAKPVPGFP